MCGRRYTALAIHEGVVMPIEIVEVSPQDDHCTAAEAARLLGMTEELVVERLVRGLLLGVYTSEGWVTSRRYVLDLALRAAGS
jgi:hypothetical protein